MPCCNNLRARAKQAGEKKRTGEVFFSSRSRVATNATQFPFADDDLFFCWHRSLFLTKIPASKSYQKALSLLHDIVLKFVSRLPVSSTRSQKSTTSFRINSFSPELPSWPLDDTVKFIFHRKIGICYYFATSSGQKRESKKISAEGVYNI